MREVKSLLMGSLCLAVVSLPQLAQESAAQEREPLHIGILAPLSGPFEELGRQVEQGVALAIEQIGDGTDVTVTAVDDGCEEERGRDAANQLVGAQVDVVIGGVCWRPAVSARNVFAFADIPFVSSGVRYQSFTDEADGPVYRLSGRDDDQARYLASAILDGTLDGAVGGPARNRPLVVFYTDGNYGRTLADGIEAALGEEGVTLALSEAFVPDGDLDALAGRAEAEGAGLVIVLAGQADSALLADALHQRLPDVPVLAGDSVMTSEFRLMAGEGVEGVVFARPTPWRTLVDEATLAELEGDDLGSMAGLVLPSMAATQVALAMLGGDEAPYETVLGPIRFDANGDANVPSFQLWQWRDGLIWPFESQVSEEG
jgi:branched-chain amino acid transport system substrate-binding protein